MPITKSEYAKSRLLNKDSRFGKDPAYVFYLLWQKELRELASGVYNLLKSTGQPRLPVGQFMSRVSESDPNVEANLSTIFQQIRGTKQFWYLKASDLKWMLREYGPPTLSSRSTVLNTSRLTSVAISEKSTMSPTAIPSGSCAAKIQFPPPSEI